MDAGSYLIFLTMAVTILTRRSDTPSKRPDPDVIFNGELALNFDAATGGLYYKDTDDNIVKVGPCQVSPTAPNSTPGAGGSAGNSLGEFWFNSTSNSLFVWNGTIWVDSTLGIAVQSVSGTSPIAIDNTDPLNPIVGVDAATTSALGVVQVGTNLNVAAGTISVPAATTAAQGAVQVGTNINVASGTISVPAATTAAQGAVQVGTNIDVASGTISVANSSTSGKGVVQLNNTTNNSSTDLALTAAQGKSLQDQIDALAVAVNITLAGSYNASTGLMTTVTTAGIAAGFLAGNVPPDPDPTNNEFFIIVDVQGSTPPAVSVGGTPPYHIGDWFLSDGVVWTFLNVGFQAPAATTTVEGVVYLATDLEVQTGTDTSNKAVNPASLQAKVSDSTSTTSSTTIASSTAVKAAYDAGVAAQGTADAALPLAGGTMTGDIVFNSGQTFSGTVSNQDFQAKGDLVAGYGANSFGIQSVGTNGQILSANSACASGLEWVAAGGGGGSPATPTVAGIVLGRTTEYNTGLGCNALVSVTSSCYNTAIGSYALCSITSSDGYNTAIGAYALCSSSGSYNTAIGTRALCSDTFGEYNTAIGIDALCSNTTGSCNTAVGSLSLEANTTGCYNTATGVCALRCSISGCYNTATGSCALFYNTSGRRNTAHGITALFTNTTGNCNSAHGTDALYGATTGNGNTATGMGSLCNITTGCLNVGIGLYSGTTLTTGSNNVAIGPNVRFPSIIGNCQLVIGANLNAYWLTGDSTLAIKPGAGIIDCANSCGTVGQYLWTTGANKIVWSASSPSDTRDKEILGPVPTALPVVQQIEPITYRWKERESEVAQEEVIYGFSAQQLQGVDAVLVDNSDPDYLRIHDRKIVPLLVKAIQELSAKVEALEAKLEANG